MSRADQLVVLLALWEAGNIYPIGSKHRTVYHQMHQELTEALQPETGEIDSALEARFKMGTKTLGA